MKRKLIAVAIAACSTSLLFGLSPGAHGATCTSQQSTNGSDTLATSPDGGTTVYGAGDPTTGGYGGVSGSSPAAAGYIQGSSTSGLTIYGTTAATPTPGGLNVNPNSPADSGQC